MAKMPTFFPSNWLVLVLLLAAYSYVSFRTVKAIKHSYGSGLFRTFANIPLVYFFLSLGAFPLLAAERILRARRESPARRRALNDAKFIGNAESRVFHSRGCEYREVMGYEKRVPFSGIEAAKKQGYRPCATCRPGFR